MYLKTTNTQFLKFGETVEFIEKFDCKSHLISDVNTDTFYIVDCEIIFHCDDGIAMIIVLDEDRSIKKFVVHKYTILNPNVPFIIIPLTKECLIKIKPSSIDRINYDLLNFESDVSEILIEPKFQVSNIFCYHYNVKGQNYSFSGESHNYWEITYVDTGQLIMEIDNETFQLQSQNLMVTLPNQYHRQKIKDKNSCSYLTILFDISVNDMDFNILKNRVFDCNQDIYQLISNFIKNSSMLQSNDCTYASSLMISYLQVIISLLFQYDDITSSNQTIINPVQNKIESQMLEDMTTYIITEIHSPITVEDICTEFSVSRSTLQTLFKNI